MIEELISITHHIGLEVVLPRSGQARVELKPDGTEVTDADLDAHAHLLDVLPRLRDAPILSEEMSAAEQAAAWAAGRAGLWVIDPIDGTNNFCRGNPYYCVSVAWLENHRPAAGVVFAPALDEMFTAAADGAFLNGRPLAASRCASLDRAVLSLGSQPSPPIRFRAIRQMGSGALELAYLAAGRFDLYLHRKNKLWDYAAAALMVDLAGGVLTDDCGQSLWREAPYGGPIIGAANAELQEELLRQQL